MPNPRNQVEITSTNYAQNKANLHKSELTPLDKMKAGRTLTSEDISYLISNPPNAIAELYAQCQKQAEMDEAAFKQMYLAIQESERAQAEEKTAVATKAEAERLKDEKAHFDQAKPSVIVTPHASSNKPAETAVNIAGMMAMGPSQLAASIGAMTHNQLLNTITAMNPTQIATMQQNLSVHVQNQVMAQLAPHGTIVIGGTIVDGEAVGGKTMQIPTQNDFLKLTPKITSILKIRFNLKDEEAVKEYARKNPEEIDRFLKSLEITLPSRETFRSVEALALTAKKDNQSTELNQHERVETVKAIDPIMSDIFSKNPNIRVAQYLGNVVTVIGIDALNKKGALTSIAKPPAMFGSRTLGRTLSKTEKEIMHVKAGLRKTQK